jgi:signal transduction histidine kinase
MASDRDSKPSRAGAESLPRDLVEAVREEERARLARELHDSLGQLLTSLGMQLGALERLEPSAVVSARLTQLRALCEEALGEVHRLAHDLGPRAMEDGLEAALGSLLQAHRRAHGTETSLTLEGARSLDTLPASVSRCVYRIVQETLTNVAKHAIARMVAVSVETSPDWVRLSVVDDGRGLASAGGLGASRGLGLAGIRARAIELGGEARFESSPGGGTIVTVQIPLSEQRE